jgi:hypothetical protein
MKEGRVRVGGCVSAATLQLTANAERLPMQAVRRNAIVRYRRRKEEQRVGTNVEVPEAF